MNYTGATIISATSLPLDSSGSSSGSSSSSGSNSSLGETSGAQHDSLPSFPSPLGHQHPDHHQQQVDSTDHDRSRSDSELKGTSLHEATLTLSTHGMISSREDEPPHIITSPAQSTSPHPSTNEHDNEKETQDKNGMTSGRRHRPDEILLPHQDDHVCYIAIDIGGSLAKVVWFAPSGSRSSEPGDKVPSPPVLGTSVTSSPPPSSPPPHADGGGRLRFARFETAKIQACFDFVQSLLPPTPAASASTPVTSTAWVLKLTGGGAYKYYDLFASLPVQIEREDEMECLISGLNFFTSQVEYEVFTYDERIEGNPLTFEDVGGRLFPYLVVNIGSGVSILKVTGPNCYERISGTSLGGGTLWGLLSLLTDADSYEDMLELSQKGDNRNVDMLVGDIYGGDYSKIGLKASTIASSFGKVFKSPKVERKSKFCQQDISRSLLYLVSNNIGQISYLNAKLHSVERIYFSGFFICGHPITMNTLSYAINFWSKGSIKALFLRHEGYLGAMGAFLKQPHALAAQEVRDIPNLDASSSVSISKRSSLENSVNIPSSRVFSYTENFSVADGSSVNAVGVLEALADSLEPFIHLAHGEGSGQDPDSTVALQPYHPDTLDLARLEDQHYWIDLLSQHLGDLVDVAQSYSPSQQDPSSVPSRDSRIHQFAQMYRQHLDRLKAEPQAYGVLTVRGLLNLREQCLVEMGFTDIFKGVKNRENVAAVQAYPAMIESVYGAASLTMSVTERGDSTGYADMALLDKLIDNVLAGNMYDWGSSSIAKALKTNTFHFQAAKDRVLRTTQMDRRATFFDAISQRSSVYRKVVIFVDNSGADVVLGIMPFARYFLLCGSSGKSDFVVSCRGHLILMTHPTHPHHTTSVILAANSKPAVNDVTYHELRLLLESLADLDTVIKSALQSGRLEPVATGSGSPCLDLSRVSQTLNKKCADADMVVLEGMGRAIHTNYHARLMVDTLKIGVFKNPRLASELGARLFDGLVLFEHGARSHCK